METYRVIRRFFNEDFGPVVIATGLSLEEAQMHCRDDEASSKTAVSADLVSLTESCGAWFDGFEEE